MGLNLSCGCWKAQKKPEQKQKEPEPEPVDYQKMTNKQTSFLHAQFMLTNPYRNFVTQEFIMSGLPDDMHREFLKLKEDAPKYIEKKYIGHTLYKVEFINLYTSPDAIIDHNSDVPPAVVPAPPADPINV